VPGARKWKNPLRFDGQALRVTLLPIALVRDPFMTNEPAPGGEPGGGWSAGPRPADADLLAWGDE